MTMEEAVSFPDGRPNEAIRGTARSKITRMYQFRTTGAVAVRALLG